MDPILLPFWDWFLKYSSLFVTAALSFLSAYGIYLIGRRQPNLVWYATHPALVPMPIPQSQPATTNPQLAGQQAAHVGTATVFIFNGGRAPAREVHVGHFKLLPAHGVWPDIPRETINLPGGGTAIRFPVIPPKVLVGISYLMASPISPLSIDEIVSYIASEEGVAKRIPVLLQRIYPPWVIFILRLLWFAGLWVFCNAALTLIVFLWRLYH